MTVPLHNLTDTWDSVGTNFDAIKMNATRTGSAGNSKLINTQVNSIVKFSVDEFSRTIINATSTTITSPLGLNPSLFNYTPYHQIHGFDNNSRQLCMFIWQNGGFGPRLTFAKSHSDTPGTFAMVEDGDGIGSIMFMASDTVEHRPVCFHEVSVDGTPGGTNDIAAKFRWYTRGAGMTNTQERMSLRGDGRLQLFGGGTITSQIPVLEMASTWNNVAVTFSAVTLNVTNTNSASASKLIDLMVGSASKFIVDVSGRVLLGHTTSVGDVSNRQSPLQLHGTSEATTQSTAFNWANNANGGCWVTAKSRSGTIGTNTIVQNGDSLGRFLFCGADGSNFITGAEIKAEVDGTPGTNDLPTRVLIKTTPDGSSSPSDRMLVDSKGNIIINTAAIATNANDGFLYIPSCAGTPTGTPTSYSGRIPMVYDTAANKIWFYNGTWRGVLVT